ncbi:MAG: class I SAM-dependent RNA methyltransferase [Oscillospiraceae bacterium]|jgi:putative N6-adenine-specific DNA methylase|nr:class I SAM-dependent RNA methyltransferase [Oscillospiraceae bacterium]
MEFKLCAPCHFGLEGPLAAELRRLNMREVRAENGRVFFTGNEGDLARASLWLRTAERLLVELGSFPAATFDELFEGVKALPLSDYFSRDAAFPVKGHCLNSKLFSVSDCQSIIKKAMADCLCQSYGLSWMPETGGTLQVRFSIMNDVASIYLDASGAGLHKRGYRPEHVPAPLSETLAAAMVILSGYRGRGDFCDPFCGSGTLPIEAALLAKNRAPGLFRSFAAESWSFIPPSVWKAAREEAPTKEYDGDYHIFASDISPEALEISRKNAKNALLERYISFNQSDASGFDLQTRRGVIVTNPPYGERLMEKREAESLYAAFGAAFAQTENWQLYLLSSHTEFERSFGRRADKKRKLYNGMIKCDLFMYL